MAEPVLLLEGVFKSYGNGVVTEVLKGVDLRVERGEFAALIGPSGSGKSTLLNILGLLDRPTRGRLTIAGEDTTHLDDAGLTRLRGRTIGFVFQFHHLLPGLSAEENVMMPMIAATGRTSKEMVPRARRLLERVGLGEKAGSRPNALSGGEQQRVAIARAVARRPDVLLCDEPTGALDCATGRVVLDVLARVNRELGSTTAVITHNAVIARMANRVIRFGDGRVVADERNPSPVPVSELQW